MPSSSYVVEKHVKSERSTILGLFKSEKECFDYLFNEIIFYASQISKTPETHAIIVECIKYREDYLKRDYNFKCFCNKIKYIFRDEDDLFDYIINFGIVEFQKNKLVEKRGLFWGRNDFASCKGLWPETVEKEDGEEEEEDAGN